MIFEAVQTVHPCGLMRKWNLSKADERDLRPVGHQTRNQFARVSPDSAEGISRHQYTHRTPEIRGLGATLGLPASSLGSRAMPREEFSCGRWDIAPLRPERHYSSLRCGVGVATP